MPKMNPLKFNSLRKKIHCDLPFKELIIIRSCTISKKQQKRVQLCKGDYKVEKHFLQKATRPH